MLMNPWIRLDNIFWNFRFVFTEATRSGVEEYEGMEVDGEEGPGPQRCKYLSHHGLVTPYGDIDLSQHWFRLCLDAWRHQAITWTKVDLSSKVFRGILPQNNFSSAHELLDP